MGTVSRVLTIIQFIPFFYSIIKYLLNPYVLILILDAPKIGKKIQNMFERSDIMPFSKMFLCNLSEISKYDSIREALLRENYLIFLLLTNEYVIFRIREDSLNRFSTYI